LGRLLRAVNESDYPPVRAEWKSYILEMGKLSRQHVGGIMGEVPTDARTRRIEQLDMASNTVIQVQ
jgi:hypothetical protein